MGCDTTARYPEQSCDLSTRGCRRLPFSLFFPFPPPLISSSCTSTSAPLSAAPRELGASREGRGKERKKGKKQKKREKKKKKKEKKAGRSSDPPARTPDCAYLVPNALCQGAQGEDEPTPKRGAAAGQPPGRGHGRTDRRTSGQRARRTDRQPAGGDGQPLRGIPAEHPGGSRQPQPLRSHPRAAGWDCPGWGWQNSSVCYRNLGRARETRVAFVLRRQEHKS